eukprot:CAMPEP_0202351316 /NCGR_PEP_ID=MMETSP1126-20121109/8014_1 /ASSEMBLY_ACC=CAM_ASM_000457 /TAXON_ID=3047 /ORGANISM="Dunaliella tertiolecta, Strain CCMP1320" /LENGTH=387 /DNA_ID=CAMNT_0048943417 /DNA_START=215 /DNA_END=1378 /DNA_ORIENTATION=+
MEETGDGIVFGKPQVGREIYEAFATAARTGMLGEVDKGEDEMDVVMAALHLASEDDAIKTRTHIPLPVDSFSKRLDGLVVECGMRVSPDHSQEEQLSLVLGHLYSTWGMKIATEMYEGSFSPYRVYMQNVLSQKCGTQASAAAVVHSLLRRMHSTGRLSFRAKVAVPLDPTGLPVAAPPGKAPVSPQLAPGTNVRPAVPTASLEGAASTSSNGSSSNSSSEAVRWVSGPQLLVAMLDQLKRFYWSWYWPVESESGFEECARVLLTDDRAGKVNPAVGVITRTGRPFGDVGLSLLACERLVQVLGKTDPNSWQHAMQMRDYGTLLLHVGQVEEGRKLLSRFMDWLQEGGDKQTGVANAHGALVQQLLKRQPVASSINPADIIDADRDA